MSGNRKNGNREAKKPKAIKPVAEPAANKGTVTGVMARKGKL
ncbi:MULTISPECIES: hypothetical protein [unclassified Devosia]|nr:MULTISPECIES: hypothetical protein [unclassified Devosia]